MQNQQLDQDRVELEAHFAERVQAYLDMGVPEDEATHLAQEKFGDIEDHLKRLRLQRYVLRPLKMIWLGIYWSLRESLIVVPSGALAISSLTLLFSRSVPLIYLLIGPGAIAMGGVASKLDTYPSSLKHWGVFGAISFWMSLTLGIGLLLPHKNQDPLSLLLGQELAVLLACAYLRIPWRRNATPTA